MNEPTAEELRKAIAYLKGGKVTISAIPSKETQEMLKEIIGGAKFIEPDEDIIIKK